MGGGFHGGFGETKGSCENGARTKESTLLMPNHTNAVTPDEKFIDYSLDYLNENARGKAEAYEKGLGYNKYNYKSLVAQIHNAITSGIAPYQVTESKYGTKYKFRIKVEGPNGKVRNVIAVYQKDKGSDLPRLITNYLEGK